MEADLSEVIPTSFSILIIIFYVSSMMIVAVGMMDSQGNPVNWNNYNGFKVGGSFMLSNDNGDFGSLDESEKEELLVKKSELTNFKDLCTLDLPGFRSEEGDIQFQFYQPKTDCQTLTTGVCIPIYSEENSRNYFVTIEGTANGGN